MRKILTPWQGFLLIFLLSISVMGADLINPHVNPEPCLTCHTKIPTDDEAQDGKYFCIKETIDATCGICHLTHLEGGLNHPSDIEDWDHNLVADPITLPLYNGKITCCTCHLHLLSDELSVYLLRKVKTDDQGQLDWSDLCRDCHIGY